MINTATEKKKNLFQKVWQTAHPYNSMQSICCVAEDHFGQGITFTHKLNKQAGQERYENNVHSVKLPLGT